MKKVRPFSNGSEFDMWDEQNCRKCQNSKLLNEGKDYKCHIDEAFSEAVFGVGEVNERITNLIGFDDRHFLKDCPFKDLELNPVKINTSIFNQLRLLI